MHGLGTYTVPTQFAQINAHNGGAEVSSCCFQLPLERAGGNRTSRGLLRSQFVWTGLGRCPFLSSACGESFCFLYSEVSEVG